MRVTYIYRWSFFRAAVNFTPMQSELEDGGLGDRSLTKNKQTKSYGSVSDSHLLQHKNPLGLHARQINKSGGPLGGRGHIATPRTAINCLKKTHTRWPYYVPSKDQKRLKANNTNTPNSASYIKHTSTNV